jgi:adenylate kinase
MKHLVLIGAPGAGKGTVAKELTEYTQLSTGDMLRAEKSKGTPLGDKVASLIDSGKFVDDETMFSIIQENIPKEESLIFDGYPRNISQIAYFEKLVRDKKDVTVIYFKVEFSVLEDRIVNRRTCSVCGEIHNTKTNPPNSKGNCNKCDGKLSLREDDNVDALVERLETFKRETLPIVDHFKDYPSFFEIEASRSPEEVLLDVKKVLNIS